MLKISNLRYVLIFLVVCISACRGNADNSPISSNATSTIDATYVTQSVELSLAEDIELSTSTEGIWTALIQNGMLYYTTAETATAYELSSGQELWSIPQGSAQTLLVGEEILVISRVLDTELIARSKLSGTEVWSIKLPPDFNPVLKGIATDGVLVFIGARDSISAVSIETGEAVWSLDVPNNFVVVSGERPMVEDLSDGYALSVDQDTLYVHLAGPFEPIQTDDGSVPLQGSAEMMLLAIDAASGKELWRFPYGLEELPTTAGPPIHSLVYYQDWVLPQIPEIVALEKHTGQMIKQINGTISRSKAVAYDNYLIVSRSEELASFDIETGENLWEISGFNPRSKSVISNGVIFLVAEIVSEDWRGVLAIDLHTGAIISKTECIPGLTIYLYVLEIAVDSNNLYIVTPTHIYQFAFTRE